MVVAQYGNGHCIASAFHALGDNPEQVAATLAAWLPAEVAEAVVQSTCPRTGLLASVMTTGPAASARRRTRRRSSDSGRFAVDRLSARNSAGSSECDISDLKQALFHILRWVRRGLMKQGLVHDPPYRRYLTCKGTRHNQEATC